MMGLPPKVFSNYKAQRLNNFLALKDHAWLNRVFKKLNLQEREHCESFLSAFGDMDKGEFEFKVNRMFMDSPSLREKLPHWKEITELLLCANSKLT